ncbi:MAG: hypothetical protein IRY95_07675, partial [Clostridia bacterium]|nr:hypothetical protein [Clostridia bacterium]
MTDGRRPERPSGERGARPHLLQPARVLALGFAALIAAGTVTLSLEPMHAPAARVTLLDALFTATSAVCVTGLTVVNTASAWSPLGQLVIALLIQAGGLGVMTLSTLVAFAIGRRITFRERILIRESLGQYEVAGVVRLTRAILLLTVLFELTGALVLTLAFSRDYPWPRAAALGLFHAVSAFNNAGFDLFGDSLIRFRSDPLVNLTVMALIVLGGLGFTVVLELFSWLRCRRPLSLHTKCVLVFTGLLIVGGTLLLAAAEWSNQATLGALPPAVRWLAASFHAVSARTAGFNT